MSDAAPAPTETMTLPVEESLAVRLGQALGAQYEVLDLLGRGGFAEVYRVHDRHLDRQLAVKVLHPGLTLAPGSSTRFREEARAVARLDHPNILPIHFVGEGHGLLYYAMPLVEGSTLTDLLAREGPLPVERAVAVADDLLAALAHAHAAGIVHRDIKPDNVMIDARSGRTLLVDFGIAKRLNAVPATTQAGFVVGTPAYMSPEQALGHGNVDHRADLYAVGAVLFQMLAGSPPYEGEDSQEVVGKHVHAPVPTPASRRGGIPDAVSRAVVRALAKDRSTRFPDAMAMRQALAGVEEPPAQGRRAVPPAHVAMGIVITALLVAAALGLASTVRSTLVVVNRLAIPVAVIAGNEGEQRVAPGDSLRLEVPRTAALQVSWYAVVARGGNDQPLGADLQHTEVMDARQQVLRVEARADAGSRPLFQPRITNATGQPLSIRINVGSGAERACRCTVPAGGRRVPVGFYPLYANSSVRAIAPDGRVATFTGLGARVDRASGEVRLRFDAGDLRDTTVLRARLR